MIDGKRLRLLRHAKGISAEEASAQMGMSRPQLVNYETGKMEPSTKNLARMMAFYGVSADYLMGCKDDPGFNELSHKEIRLILAVRAQDWKSAMGDILEMMRAKEPDETPTKEGSDH